METLLFILLCVVCVVLIAVLLPYIIAIPIGIAKAVFLIVSGRENDPEIVDLKEARLRERSAKAEVRRKRRREFWLPSSFRRHQSL